MSQPSPPSITHPRFDGHVFRAMAAGDSGAPRVGDSDLGVRVPRDILADDENRVSPATGGMSVADDPANLHLHFKPRSLGGTGKKPVWMLHVDDLGARLVAIRDGRWHGTVSPAVMMMLTDYRAALADTADAWEVHTDV